MWIFTNVHIVTSLSMVVARDMLNLVVPILLEQSPVRICTYVNCLGFLSTLIPAIFLDYV